MDASSIFERFLQASTFRCVQQTFFQLCCALDIHPCDSRNLYTKLRKLNNGKLHSKAGKLWSLLDKKWNQPEYCAQKACHRLNVLIIGSGPCGLRAAIECALLGAHVVVVEQRDKFSRHNVLHLWNFVIQDLKSLGTKIFFPKFCTGSIEHISIRRLQCILLKVALVLGVQVHENVSFLNLIEPTPDNNDSGNYCGWKANFEPHGHVLAGYEFDALIGADGKRDSIPGFPKKVVRGKLAIGITANFVNGRTAIEEKVMEISGVAYIFNQSFFNEMHAKTGIDLENIVYYKDDTHYFVMSAKKQSLLQKGVIRQDFEDISALLAKDNVDHEMLCKYAAQAADFATNGKLPQLTFARNANLEPDVAMFDFTALSSAVFSTRLLERHTRSLILTIVGDSLHEPFWPTGSGCARGFLSVLDTAWMLRAFGTNAAGPMEIIAERENVYRLLAQTTKENMRSSYLKYTIDPKTRYKRIDDVMSVEEVCEQIDTDSPRLRPTSKPLYLRLAAGESDNDAQNLSPAFSRIYRLWLLCYRILLPLKIRVINFKVQSWGDGKALAALVGKFRPDILSYAMLCNDAKTFSDELIEAAFSTMEVHYKLRRPCAANAFEWSALTDERRATYIEAIVCAFLVDKTLINTAIIGTATGAVVAEQPTNNNGINRFVAERKRSTTETNRQEFAKNYKDGPSDVKYRNNNDSSNTSNNVKRPSVKKLNPAVVDKLQRMVSGSWEKEQLKKFYVEKNRTATAARSNDKSTLTRQPTTTTMNGVETECNTQPTTTTAQPNDDDSRTRSENNNDAVECHRLADNNLTKNNKNNNYNNNNNNNSAGKMSQGTSMARLVPQLDFARPNQRCSVCGLEAYLAEQMYLEKTIIHKRCFKCGYCGQHLRLDNCTVDRQLSTSSRGLQLFCGQHAQLSFDEKIARLSKSPITTGTTTTATTTTTTMGPTTTTLSFGAKTGDKHTFNGVSIAIVPGISRSNDDKSGNDNEAKNENDDIAWRVIQRMRSRELDLENIRVDLPNHISIHGESKPYLIKEFEKNTLTDGKNSCIITNEDTALVNYRQQRMINALRMSKAEQFEGERTSVVSQPLQTTHSSLYAPADKETNSASVANRHRESHLSMWNEASEMRNYCVSDEIIVNDDDDDDFSEMLDGTLIDEQYLRPSKFLTDQNIRPLMERFNRTRLFDSPRRPLSRTSFGSANDIFHSPALNDTLYFTPKSSFPSAHRIAINEADDTKRIDNNNPDITSSNDNKRRNRMSRVNPRRATVTIDAYTFNNHNNNSDKDKLNTEMESVYSTSDCSEPTSGVLIRKQRRDRLRNKNLDAVVQDTGRIAQGSRSNSSSNFSLLLSSFKAMLNENDNEAVLLSKPENVSRAKHFARNAISRREKDEQQLNAHEIRRTLDALESRVDEVRDIGCDLERRLVVEPDNEWLLENWLFYSEELKRLSSRETQLRARIRLINSSEKYKRLRDELHAVQARNNDSRSTDDGQLILGDGIEKEKLMMEQMLNVIDEHKAIKAKLEQLTKQSTSLRSLTIEEVHQILTDKQYTFKNFDPVFLKATTIID